MNALTYVPHSRVLPAGDISTARLIIIGEQPNILDVSDRRPFSGPSGRELTGLLTRADVAISECYRTYVIKDLEKYVGEYIYWNKKEHHVDVTPDGSYYLEALRDELAQANPNAIIIAMGNISLYALTGQWGLHKRRGSIYKSDISTHWVVPTYNPSTIYSGEDTNRLLIQWDILKAINLYSGKIAIPNLSVVTRPSFQTCVDWLTRLFREGISGASIACDIEVSNEELDCISFGSSLDPQSAISIPFTYEGGMYFSIPQEITIMKLIGQILEHPAITILGQNLIFDTHFLLRKYGIKTVNLDDTMVAQKITMGDYPVGLDFICSIHTNIPYYKDEGKKWFSGKSSSYDNHWLYNGKDSIACLQAFPRQKEILENQGNWEIYRSQCDLIEPLTYFMEHGIRCDVDGMANAALKYTETVEELEAELNELAGREISARSSAQLKKLFYEERGYTPYKKRATGKITTDDNALKRLVRKGSKEAAVVQKIRKNSKILSTYLPINSDGELLKIDKDGRIRCSYNPVGTRYSRISSSENIFGTGMNMQNWPHNLKKYLLPDEGYGYFSFDLSNAENKIVAYVGQVEALIEVFEKGLDAHKMTASLIFDKPYESISDEAGSCKLGDGTKSERDFGKRANHGLNYDFGYKAFAFMYEMPEPQARFIVERYHKVYPGIRNVFHKLVRQELQSNRTVTNLLGRKTYFYLPMGDELFKAAYSCIPQGTVGDIMNKYGVNHIYYNQDLYAEVELLEQVHDSLGFQIPLSVGWDRIAEIILSIKKNLEVPLTAHGRDFIINADLTFGPSFYKKDCRELKGKKFPLTVETLAPVLKAKWEEMTNVTEVC